MNNETLYHKFIFINQMIKRRNANQKSITHGQGKILAILNQKDGISTKELSEILNINVTSLNETLNKLIKQNYLEKRVSQEDKRIRLIYLTEKGRKFKIEKPKDIDIFNCLSEHEKENLDRYLNLINREIHERVKAEDPVSYEKMSKSRKNAVKKCFCCDVDDIDWFKII